MTKLDQPTAQVAIRLAGPADATAVERLRQRDTQPPPHWPLLVAEVNGSMRAAVSLPTGQALADPFHHTAHLLIMLATRAAQFERPRRKRLAFRRARHYARPEPA